MTPQEYIAAGYSVSQHIEQVKIDQAETLVEAAYLLPMCPNETLLQSPEAKAAKMALAVLWLCRHSAFATRVGGREKLTAQSVALASEKANPNLVEDCYLRLKTLQEKEGAMSMDKATDICGVFFKSVYFNI